MTIFQIDFSWTDVDPHLSIEKDMHQLYLHAVEVERNYDIWEHIVGVSHPIAIRGV